MKKFLKYPICAVLLVVAVLSVSSCKDDDDGYLTQIYYQGMVETTEGTAAEAESINEAFVEAMKVFGDPMEGFNAFGNLKACNKNIISRCQLAEETLKNKTFSGNYTYTIFYVTNRGEEGVVYTHKFE